MTTEYLSLVSPQKTQLVISMASLIAVLGFLLFGLIQAWSKAILIPLGVIFVAASAFFLVSSIAIVQFSSTDAMSSNITTKYDVAGASVSSPSKTMAEQPDRVVTAALDDGSTATYFLLNNPETNEPTLIASDSYSPDPSTLERTR